MSIAPDSVIPKIEFRLVQYLSVGDAWRFHANWHGVHETYATRVLFSIFWRMVRFIAQKYGNNDKVAKCQFLRFAPFDAIERENETARDFIINYHEFVAWIAYRVRNTLGLPVFNKWFSACSCSTDDEATNCISKKTLAYTCVYYLRDKLIVYLYGSGFATKLHGVCVCVWLRMKYAEMCQIPIYSLVCISIYSVGIRRAFGKAS